MTTREGNLTIPEQCKRCPKCWDCIGGKECEEDE